MIEIFNILFLISIFSLNIFFIHYLFLFCENSLSRSVQTKDLDTSIISFLFIILLGLIFNLDIKILGIFFLTISFITILFFLFFKIKLENYQLLIIFFFLSIYGSISILVDLEISHDAQKFYIPRSIDIFFNGINNDIDSGFDKNRSIPLYGPYAWATFRYSSIISNEIFGRLLSLFLFNFTYLILISRLLVKDNIKNLLFILFFFLTFDNYHFDGKLDIFVFIINVLISIVFYDVLFNKKIQIVI